MRIKLKRNFTFYLKKAKQKLDFLHDEAKDPFMSKHNLGTDFRKGSKSTICCASSHFHDESGD